MPEHTNLYNATNRYAINTSRGNTKAGKTGCDAFYL